MTSDTCTHELESETCGTRNMVARMNCTGACEMTIIATGGVTVECRIYEILLCVFMECSCIQGLSALVRIVCKGACELSIVVEKNCCGEELRQRGGRCLVSGKSI